MTIRLTGSFRKILFVSVLLATVVSLATPSVSDDFSERRVTAGAKIFRALLAADVDIDHKTDDRGELRLCLLYTDNIGSAEKAAATLVGREDPRIRELSVRIEMLPYEKCIVRQKGQEPFAGIFLTQRLNAEQLQALTAFANTRNLVVFSPFEGDVERGVQSGIAVEARVRPYLNTNALRAARVQLKSFFLKVAKIYEE